MPAPPPSSATAPPRPCAVCGYDLRASTGDRCPECGVAIDRAAPGSHAPVPQLGSWLFRLRSPWTIAASYVLTFLAVTAVFLFCQGPDAINLVLVPLGSPALRDPEIREACHRFLCTLTGPAAVAFDSVSSLWTAIAVLILWSTWATLMSRLARRLPVPAHVIATLGWCFIGLIIEAVLHAPNC